MKARLLRSWLQNIKQHPFITVGIVVSLLAIIVFTFAVHVFGWDWTGFNSGANQITITNTSKGNYTATISQPPKSLWDWLGLLAVLAIPVVVGWFTIQQGKVSDRENTDNQRETALQAYIDKISELLLHKHLGESPLPPESNKSQVQVIARARTVTILRVLDLARRGSLIRFLSQASILKVCLEDKLELAGIDLHGVNLAGVNLSGINLSEAYLGGASLSGADLSDAKLNTASLSRANLSGANLSGAELIKADLKGADLSGTNLRKAILRDADLTGADILVTDLIGADLSRANLRGAYLIGANLRGANLRGANLWKAKVFGADLSGADLSGAKISEEQLKEAKSLEGTTMADGKVRLGPAQPPRPAQPDRGVPSGPATEPDDSTHP